MKSRSLLLAVVLALGALLVPQAVQADPSTAARAAVGTQVPKLAVTADHTVYAYGGKAKLTVVLSSPTTNRTVTLWVKFDTGGEKPVTKVTVPVGSTKKTVAVTVTRNAVFRAEFAGDETYAATRASHHVSVRSKATVKAPSTSMSGAYHRVKASPAPLVTATTSPLHGGTCVRATGLLLVKGQWTEFGNTKCLRTNSSGRVSVRLNKFRAGDRVKMAFKVSETSDNVESLWAEYLIVFV